MKDDNRNYKSHLVRWLPGLLSQTDSATRILGMGEALVALTVLDLEPARGVLTACYSGRPGGLMPRDPVKMFRCLLLMTMTGETRFNTWVDLMKGHSELVVLSGFDPETEGAPGVGTFYDFVARILDGPQPKRCSHVHKPSSKIRGNKGKFRRQLKEEKKAARAAKAARESKDSGPASEGAVRKAVRAAMVRYDEGALPKDFQERLQEILMCCVVVPSVKRGLFGKKKLGRRFESTPSRGFRGARQVAPAGSE